VTDAECELRARVAEASGRAVTELRPLEGGHSGLTYAVGLEPGLRAVVKATPPGRKPVGRHDVLRQERVLRALAGAGGVLVPEVLFAETVEPPFFGMSFVDGVGTEPTLDGTDEPAEVVASLWEQAVAILAALHAVDPVALGLAAGETSFSPREELDRWQATAHAGEQAPDTEAWRLADALAATAPAPGPPALVHGDYRLGNMLRRDGRVLAVIDWEIWSLGEPLADLGWLAIFTHADCYPGISVEVAGTPTRDHVVARYAELSGRAVADAAWFGALACFKMASVQSHNLRRHREGRHIDPFQERMPPVIRRLYRLGLELLEG